MHLRLEVLVASENGFHVEEPSGGTMTCSGSRIRRKPPAEIASPPHLTALASTDATRRLTSGMSREHTGRDVTDYPMLKLE